MKTLNNYIKESLDELDINLIKDFLIKYYKVSTWEECVDKQKFGDCDKLCRKIFKKFPNTFDYLYDLNLKYSKIAMEKLRALGDTGEDFGNHYVLVRNNHIYDFGKGTNTINGIYLLTQREDMKDKYNIHLSKEEQNCIESKIRRVGIL